MGNSLCSKRRVDQATQFGSLPLTTRAKARAVFVNAVRRVIHLLKLRRRWSAYGRILQQYPRKDLWTGLRRENGRLVRTFPASIGFEAAAPRAKRLIRNDAGL